MSDIIRVKIRDAYHQIKAAERMLEDGFKSLSRVLETVGECEEILLERGIENLPLCDEPITEHRREHRMGRVPKIDADPDLKAFILARIDRLTYTQMEKEIAVHFPRPRRVSKSTIHHWASRQNRG